MKACNLADMSISVIKSEEEFDTLEAEWSQLADDCTYTTVFQTYEWNRVWWRHFGKAFGRSLNILILRDEQNKLIGLAPLFTSFWYSTPLRRLSFIGTGASDYLDIIAKNGCEEFVVKSIYDFISHMPGWQIGDLQQLREDGLLRQYPPTQFGSSLIYVLDALQEPCPYLPLGDWQWVLAGMGKKTRYNIGYYDRSLQKLHDVEFGWANEQNVDDEMSHLFELHQRRWNKRWLPGVFGNNKVQNFHRNIAKSFLKKDWLRLYYLHLDGVTEACIYCFSFRERICYYQGGFEPTLAKLSLGTVLTSRAMQSAIEDGKTQFDFLRGDEPYKAKWTALSKRNSRRLLGRYRLFHPLIRAIFKLEDTIETRGKELMRKLR